MKRRLWLYEARGGATADVGTDFVDLYYLTGANTACDGAERGIGGIFEDSQVTLIGVPIPFYAHPNEIRCGASPQSLLYQSWATESPATPTTAATAM